MAEPLVLFDLDGTLVKAGGAGAKSMSMAFQELFGRSNAFARVSFTGMTDPAILAEAFKHTFGREPTLRESRDFFELYLNILAREVPMAKHYRVLPGIPQLLQALTERKIPIGLATGNLREGAKIKLDRAGLWSFFPVGGFGSDSKNRTELTRTAILRAQTEYGRKFSPDRVWVIGDSPAEARVAKELGTRVLLVATGWTPAEDLRDLKPDLCVRDFSDWETVVNALTQI